MAASGDGEIAKDILRDHYSTLADCISAPVKLGQELFQKRVISDTSLRDIETEGWSISKKNTSLLRSVRVAIGQDHIRLGILAQILTNHEETSTVGKTLLQKYKDTFGQEELINNGSLLHDSRQLHIKSNSLEEELQFPSEHQVLGTDDLIFLCKLLKHFNDWSNLGLNLGIKKTTLDRIQLENPDIKSRRHEMLFCWLQGQSDDIAQKITPSLANLIDILKEIDDIETAEQIKAKIVS